MADDDQRDPGTADDNVRQLRVKQPKREVYEGRTPQGVAELTRSGKLTRATRRSKVLALRAAGATIDQIHEVMEKQGYPMSTTAIEMTLNKALEDMRTSNLANVESVRALQLERLDRMVAKLWPKVLEGNLKAIAEVRNIETLRARIAGTEAPRKIEHTGAVEHRVSQQEVHELERAWIDSTATDMDDAQLVGP